MFQRKSQVEHPQLVRNVCCGSRESDNMDRCQEVNKEAPGALQIYLIKSNELGLNGSITQKEQNAHEISHSPACTLAL